MIKLDFCVIVPMANESVEFDGFVFSITEVLNELEYGVVYLIIDEVSKDNTFELCTELSQRDDRFITIWAPENRNIVDAYLRGYKEALMNGHDLIIEMDAGLSHDPKELPKFLKLLNEGNDCAFGSRFIKGGSICDSSWKRWFLSKGGTILSNLFLGTKMHDMTSGFQGFRSEIVRRFFEYNFLSKAHFYQTELRYLLRNTKYTEVPIHYKAPSPSVSKKAIINSIQVLHYYFWLRIKGKPASV